MSEDTAADLRSWLIEPDYSSEQREPIELNSTQKQLIFTRTDTGFRRIRGAAGLENLLLLLVGSNPC